MAEADVRIGDGQSGLEAALRAPVESGTIGHASRAIRFRQWGGPSHNAVVLVHGIAANVRWWDFVAPALSAGRTVTALDLSGHGGSDHEDSYSVARWAEQVLAVAATFDTGRPPVLIAHSLGGLVALQAAALEPDAVSGVILIDSAARIFSPVEIAARTRRANLPTAHYASADEAIRRFKPMYSAREIDPVIREHVERASIALDDAGWSLCFDRRVFARQAHRFDELGRIGVPVSAVRATEGLLSAERADEMADQLGGWRALRALEGGHNLMLESPRELASALDELLAAEYDAR